MRRLCSIFQAAKLERLLKQIYLMLQAMHPPLKSAALVLAGVLLTQIAAIDPATAETRAPSAISRRRATGQPRGAGIDRPVVAQARGPLHL